MRRKMYYIKTERTKKKDYQFHHLKNLIISLWIIKVQYKLKIIAWRASKKMRFKKKNKKKTWI